MDLLCLELFSFPAFLLLEFFGLSVDVVAAWTSLGDRQGSDSSQPGHEEPCLKGCCSCFDLPLEYHEPDEDFALFLENMKREGIFGDNDDLDGELLGAGGADDDDAVGLCGLPPLFWLNVPFPWSAPPTDNSAESSILNGSQSGALFLESLPPPPPPLT